MPDMPGHDATRRDDLHTMTLEELEVKIAQAGIVMSRRQIMRHCAGDTFDAKKLPALNNIDEWFIAPASVENGIADIKALRQHRVRRDATRRDTSNNGELKIAPNGNTVAPGHDATRPDMTEKGIGDGESKTEPDTSRYVALLERDNEFLRDQVKKKDEHIDNLSTRFSETQSLLGAMQRMFAPLLGQGDPFTSNAKREVVDGNATTYPQTPTEH
jgi:hypothetical protein